MKKTLTLSFIFFVCLLSGQSQSITRLIGASPFQDSLWVFDTTNYDVVRRLAPSPSSGGTITGTNGMARNPISNDVYVVFKQSAVTGRLLGKLDPLTGIYTIIGNLGDNFSSITFSSDGRLFGVTGDGATVPETVYKIDTATGAKTILRALGNGADGEIICYNSDDNMIYHWSGGSTLVYEKFDTAGVTVTNIPTIGTTNGETFSACYYGNNTFLTSNISSRFQTFKTDGTVGVQIGSSSPDDIRGTVLITCPRVITGTPAFCIGGSTILTAIDGSSSYQWYQNGVLLPGETNQNITVSSVGNYNCLISDVCGTDSLSAGVAVIQNPLPSVTLSGNAYFCTGDSTLLSGSSGGTSQWYFNGIPIPGANYYQYFASNVGLYNMTKTNLNGCTDSAATGIYVAEFSNPVVTATSDPANGIVCEGGEVTLFGGGANSYVWSGIAVDGVPFIPVTSGLYVVTGTNAFGCSDTASVYISVIDCSGIDEANASSGIHVFPNPATNFISIKADLPLGQIIIYNTLGEKVCTAFSTETTFTIEVSGFTPGIYMLKTDNGMITFIR